MSLRAQDGRVCVGVLPWCLLVSRGIPPPPPFINCTQMLVDNNRSEIAALPLEQRYFDFNVTFERPRGNITKIPTALVDCTWEPDIPELPACRYFDNDKNEWSDEGCVTAGYTNNSIISECCITKNILSELICIGGPHHPRGER